MKKKSHLLCILGHLILFSENCCEAKISCRASKWMSKSIYNDFSVLFCVIKLSWSSNLLKATSPLRGTRPNVSFISSSLCSAWYLVQRGHLLSVVIINYALEDIKMENWKSWIIGLICNLSQSILQMCISVESSYILQGCFRYQFLLETFSLPAQKIFLFWKYNFQKYSD